MRIKSVAIKNFRSCEDVRVELGPLTAIVGANGCGKSAALRALEFFYATTVKVTPDDFFGRQVTRPIEIEVTFGDLSEAERTLFGSYIDGNTLTVLKQITLANGKVNSKMFGSRLGNPDFAQVREMTAKDAKLAYKALQEQGYSELPNWSTQTAANANMNAWEAANPEKCARLRDDGAFFGFSNVASGNRGKATRLLFVPAVRDAAADAQDGKGSVIAELVDVVVRRAMAERPDFKELTNEVRSMHETLLAGDGSTGVVSLGGRLTQTLATYVPGATVDVRWEPTLFELPLPRATVSVAEDGFLTGIASCGHGLQRAFIMSLLQELVTAQSSVDTPAPDDSGDPPEAGGTPLLTPDMVLVIEEPELFQHPSRQRHLASILAQLAEAAPGKRVQIVYCTHSPHFVGVDRFEQVRLFRRVPSSDPSLPKVTSVSSTTLQVVAERLATAKAEIGPVDGAALRARLASVMTPGTSEGFFADVAVLVEGDGDRAAIHAVAELMESDLESVGVAVIPCSGKTNVPTVAAVLEEIGIATYVVWDGDAQKGETKGSCAECGKSLDKKPDPKDNHALLRLVGQPHQDFPLLQVGDRFACFHTDLEQTLADEIGEELFNGLLDDVKQEFGMTKREAAIKNSRVLRAVLKRAADQGKSSATMSNIVGRIIALRKQGVAPAAMTVGEDVQAAQ